MDDEIVVGAVVSPDDNGQATAASAQAAPSTSVLSDAPITEGDATQSPEKVSEDEKLSAISEDFGIPAQNEHLIQNSADDAAQSAATGSIGWKAAKDQVMRDTSVSDQITVATPSQDTPVSVRGRGRGGRGSRGGKRASFATDGDGSAVKTEGNAVQTTPVPRGRGRGGRPRGRGRGGGRGGKRKREGSYDEDTDDSEVYSPVVTMTKSGRSIQKPTSFVPPPPSPDNPQKRKRPYRRNPESAVCKVCLRGTSPASNMIVFCDGCNTPYHRYCHHPPIDQAVVDEVDKEWYCKPCEKQRVVPVPESDLTDFVSAPGASLEQRQRYFASLAPGMLVTLLTKATTIDPSLPLFAPDFQARLGSHSGHTSTNQATPVPQKPMNSAAMGPPAANGHSQPAQRPHMSTSGQLPTQALPQNAQATAGASSYQQSYPNIYIRDQVEEPVPEGHPPNYPRPGYGLMRTLPPERDDTQWLVEDEDRYGVFSHMYQVDPQAAHAGLNGVQSM